MQVSASVETVALRAGTESRPAPRIPPAAASRPRRWIFPHVHMKASQNKMAEIGGSLAKWAQPGEASTVILWYRVLPSGTGGRSIAGLEGCNAPVRDVKHPETRKTVSRQERLHVRPHQHRKHATYKS